jgi:ferredoxin-NADP reductase
MKIELSILDIIEETINTKSFILKDVNTKIKDFNDGQYITLNIIQNNELIKRSYSISSPAEILPLLRITVKNNSNSPEYTSFCNNLKIGDILEAEPITGNFYITEKENINKYLFIAAGSGITPIISMIRGITKRRQDVEVKLLYQNRNEDLVIFKDEIEELSKKYSNFSYELIFSKPVDIQKHESIRINPAFVSYYYVKNKELINSSEIFVCGPNQFIDMIFGTLKEFGIKENRLFREIFVKKEVLDTKY